MNKTIADKVRIISAEALEIFISVDKEQTNQIPFKGSWTIGQVGEHILKASSWILKSLEGKVIATHRDAGEKAEQIEKVFLDFNNKMKSPDFIGPSDDFKNREILIESLEHKMSRIENIATINDLTSICTSAELPGFGALTRLEWITFYNCHTKRHVSQLKKIKKALDNSHEYLQQ